CAADPKFFEHGPKRLTQGLTKISARILSTIVRSVLSDPPMWGIVTDDAKRERRGSSSRRTSLPGGSTISAPERSLAQCLTPTLLGLMEDATHLGADSNRAFPRAFVAAILSSEGGLTSAEGSLSAEDLVRAKKTVLTQVYDDANVIARITESTDKEVRSIS